MPSSAWDRFKDSLDRGITSRADLESLDLVALSELNDLERERARQMLSAKVGDSDPRIVDALAYIDTPKAWADVERAFSTGYGSALIHAAAALWRRNQDPRVLPKLQAEALGHPDAPSYVVDVLVALGKLPGDTVDDVLLEVITNTKQSRVRSMALEQLYARTGLAQWEHEGSPLFALTCGVRSNFPAVRAKSFAELRDLLQRKRAGETDAQLGIVAQPLAQRSPELQALLQLAFHPESAPVPDTATIGALQGAERLWAIDLLLARLALGDARVVPLLEHLGGDRIQLALDDYRAGRRIDD